MRMKLGVVVLAAGMSVRFGRNKLLCSFAGKPLICRALDAAKKLEAERFAAVVSDSSVAKLARERGFDVIENDKPEIGQAHSVVLGTRAMEEMNAVLFLAGDMPLLMGESLRLLVQRFEASGRGIACLEDGTHMGNPAVFAKRYFPELLALSGDRGAKGILRMHADDLLTVRCLDENELTDADTPEALEAIRRLNKN